MHARRILYFNTVNTTILLQNSQAHVRAVINGRTKSQASCYSALPFSFQARARVTIYSMFPAC